MNDLNRPILCLLSVLAALLGGYVVNVDGPSFQPLAWDTSVPLTFSIWEGSDSSQNVAAGSAVKKAFIEVLSRWARTSSISIQQQETPVFEVLRDGLNTITLADTPENRNIIPSSFTLGRATIYTDTNSPGRIREADVLLQPAVTWTTIESESGARNILDVALHEIGHALNLDHTVVGSAAMFLATRGFRFGLNRLTWDDLAGINTSYPLPGLSQITGSISGQVTVDQEPVFGAFVVAVDQDGVVSASGLTDQSGHYEIHFLPPGDYTVYVEPADGPTAANNLFGGFFADSGPGPAINADFLPTFYQDSMEANVSVRAGGPNPLGVNLEVDFSPKAGSSILNPHLVGINEDLGTVSARIGSAEARRGQNEDRLMQFTIAGDGIHTLGVIDPVRISGDNLSAVFPLLTDGTFNDGTPFQTGQLTVPPEAVLGPYSVYLRSAGGQDAVLTGAIDVLDSFRFLSAFAQFVHPTSEVLLINPDSDFAATVKLETRDSLGEPSAPLMQNTNMVNPGSAGTSNDTFNIPPGGTTFVRSQDDFVGSARMRSDRFLGSAVLIENEFGLTGIGPSRPLYSFVAPIQVEGGGDDSEDINTGFAITNLDSREVQLYLQVQDKMGTLQSSNVITLDGHAHRASFIKVGDSGGLFPTLPDNFQGTLLVTSNRKIAATVIRTSPGVFTTFPVVENRVSARVTFAHFANIPNAQLSSVLILVNPSSELTATVRIQVRVSDGSPPSGLTLGGTAVPEGGLQLDIPPLGCATLESGGTTLTGGAVEVVSENGVPVGGVVLFSSPEVGTAGVGESVALKKLVVPLERDLGSGVDTGIAVANLQADAITLEITARDSQGFVVVEPKTIGLVGFEQFATFPNRPTLDLGLPDSFRGSLWIEVLEPEGFVALTVIRQSTGILTTFPAIDLVLPLTTD